MRNRKGGIRNKKLILISCFILLTFVAACGRRGDPIVPPYKEEGVVKNLIKNDNLYLTWGMKQNNRKDWRFNIVRGERG